MDIDIKEKKFVTKQEILDSNNVIYNGEDDEGDDEDYKMSENLPDVNQILDGVLQILQYIDSDEIRLVQASSPSMVEQMIEDKFPEFTSKWYGIFQMLLSGEDITPLFKMLDVIDNVNKKKMSTDDAEKNVGKYLTKFLPGDLLEKMSDPNCKLDTKVNNIKKKHK